MGVSIKDRITTAAFRRLMAVQIASSLVSLAGSVIDGVVISRFLGPVCMSGYGIANPVVIVLAAAGFVLAAGSQALCGGHMGRGETGKVEEIMNGVILTALLAALFFNALLFFLPEQIASLLGAEGEILAPCGEYLKTYSFSTYGMLLTPVLVGFMQMDRDGGRALGSSVVFVLSSTALDLLNALVLKWGMTGMGLTTAIAYMISLAVLFFHFAKKDRSLSLHLKGASLKDMEKVLRLGLPAATYHACNFAKVLSANLLVIAVGSTAGIFSQTVLQSVNSLVVGFFTGTGSAVLLLSSVIAGEGNRRSLHHTLRYIVRVALITGLAVAAAVSVSSGWFLADFFCTGEAAVYRDTVVRMLRIYSLSIPLCMENTVFINYFQAMGNIRMSNLLCVLDNTVYALCLMYLFSGLWGLDGIWISFAAAELLALMTLSAVSWIKRRKFPVSLHDLMNLPEDFGVDEAHRLNLTVTGKEELSSLCDQILHFCERLGVEEKKAYAAAHCAEELAALSLENRGRICVDLYLTFKDGELRLRMRDNGIPIDVSKLNSEESLGMKIAEKMAKELNYSVVLGLNVFTVLL